MFAIVIGLRFGPADCQRFGATSAKFGRSLLGSCSGAYDRIWRTSCYRQGQEEEMRAILAFLLAFAVGVVLSPALLIFLILMINH